MTATIVSAFMMVNFIGLSLQHGRMMEPVQRSSMWREGYNTEPNYEDTQLYCGGRDEIQRLGGLCGVCGDPYTADVRENEAGGRFATGIIVKSYPKGTSQIQVTIELTAHHKGYYEFRICPHNNISTPVSQECLNRYPLPVAEAVVDEGEPTRYYPEAGGFHNLNLILPRGMTCSQCVLQWRYRTGNSWGIDEKENRGCIGCGVQEEFRNCADISIGAEKSGIDDITRPNPLPVTEKRPRTPPRPRIPPRTTTSTTTTTPSPTTTTTPTTARPQPDVNGGGFRGRWWRLPPNRRPIIVRRPSPVPQRPVADRFPVSDRRPSPAMTRPELRNPPRRPRITWTRPGSPRSHHRIGSRQNPIIDGVDIGHRSWGGNSFVNIIPTTTQAPVRTTKAGVNWDAINRLNLEQLRTFLRRIRMIQSPFWFSRSRTQAPTRSRTRSSSLANRAFMSPEMPMSGQGMSFRVSDNTLTIPAEPNEAGVVHTAEETTPGDLYINEYNTLSNGALEAESSPKEAWYTNIVASMKNKNKAGSVHNDPKKARKAHL
ncbi:uncharacterized protein LOC110445403 [Mizuhopecten yessoensis]|uniref:uncharacterized protein LOC110445403 n=1 Tax=Mizuhopecten yessoensis TaxID=6573 RepID=UPI000B45E3DC|nr:uncharacterized protein LOC110445403 [Mizuhopecten yessoensis]